MTALVIVAFCFVVLVVIYVIETVWPEQPDPDLASPDGWDPSTAWDEPLFVVKLPPSLTVVEAKDLSRAWDGLWNHAHDR